MIAPMLPGRIPGLLLEGSPVVAERKTHCGIDKGTRGVVLCKVRRAVFAVAWPGEVRAFRGHGGISPTRQSVIGLDLGSATGRAHATWWLGANGMSGGHERQWVWRQAASFWEVRSVDGSSRSWLAHSGWRGSSVPGLAPLNPKDALLLPDGSRWVDAEALRLVCLHLWGQS